MADLLDESPSQAAEHDAAEHQGDKPKGAGKPGAPKPAGKKDYTPIIVIVSIVGVLITWLAYKHQSATTASAATAPTTGTGSVAGDSTDPNAAPGFANMISNLEAEVAQLQFTVQANGPVGHPASTPTTPTSPSHPTSPSIAPVPPGHFRVHGGFNQQVSLRSIAASLLPSGASANAIEAKLRALVAANPGLKGRTTFLGGHLLNDPAATQHTATGPTPPATTQHPNITQPPPVRHLPATTGLAGKVPGK